MNKNQKKAFKNFRTLFLTFHTNTNFHVFIAVRYVMPENLLTRLSKVDLKSI